MGTAEHFESKSEVMGGKLCFRGTRIPVQAILEVIRAGWDDPTILAQFQTLSGGALEVARGMATAEDRDQRERRVA
ncbi:MAG: DUF433 domain-containing protein [Armatimonadetes bacterium]|nr:DUF433 domain-containing protein [Armatimonadota bacterium]